MLLPLVMATELQEDVAQVAKELQRDVEGTCAAVVSELVACDDPTHWLELLTTLAASDALPAELVERLDSELLPQVVQLLLGRAFDLSAVERVNAFYQWTLSAVVKSLQRGRSLAWRVWPGSWTPTAGSTCFMAPVTTAARSIRRTRRTR